MAAPDMASRSSQKESGIRAEQSSRAIGSIGLSGRRRLGLVMSGLAAAALGLGAYLAICREAPSADAVWAQAQADLKEGRLDRTERVVARLVLVPREMAEHPGPD